MMFPTDESIQPVPLARALEERGFESVFFPEHTHIPASRRTPFPGGGELPRHYWHTHDPFVALAAAAAVTTRLRLATGICLVVERDPIVLAMKAIWTQDEASYHGEHVQFDRIWSWPKPLQPGGPPILLGADSKWGTERVVEYCDGWMPIAHGKLDQGLARLRDACSRAGRAFDSVQLTVFATPPREDVAKRLRDLGFSRIVFAVPSESPETVLPHLDRLAEIARTLA